MIKKDCMVSLFNSISILGVIQSHPWRRIVGILFNPYQEDKGVHIFSEDINRKINIITQPELEFSKMVPSSILTITHCGLSPPKKLIHFQCSLF